MRKTAICLLIIHIHLVFHPFFVEGKSKLILNPKIDIQEQFHTDFTTYIVKEPIDLQGKTVTIPKGSELVFKRKGKISNGIIEGNSTTLKGKVQLSCMLTGIFSNEVFYVSWLSVSDRKLLAQQIASIFKLKQTCVVKLDRDIALDGSHQNVDFVAFSGNKVVRNCCSYKVRGDVKIKGVTFIEFETQRELFLNMQGITRPVSIEIKDVHFDGNWNIARFVYCPYIELDSPSKLVVSSSEFTRVRNFIIQFRSPCTGIMRDNRIKNIGTDKFSNVIGFHLGDSSREEDRYCAHGFEITNNVFENFIVPYNEKDDGREVHALLIYGYKNIIKRNKVINFLSEKGDGDTGRDSEGIYLKGGDNIVENNYLENCIGSGPDGAITIKSSYSNNRIAGNTIKHQYGLGIQCYSPHSIVENNKVYSEHYAVAGMAMVFNIGSTIVSNAFYASSGKQYHSAVALTSCENISISNNTFNNTSGLLTTRKCSRYITFKDNEVFLSGKLYGTNTYYSAPVELHDDTADYLFINNTFSLEGVRASQLIETPLGFKGSVELRDNHLNIKDSKEISSSIAYLVRNASSLTVDQNTVLGGGKKIGKLSNLMNQ